MAASGIVDLPRPHARHDDGVLLVVTGCHTDEAVCVSDRAIFGGMFARYAPSGSLTAGFSRGVPRFQVAVVADGAV